MPTLVLLFACGASPASEPADAPPAPVAEPAPPPAPPPEPLPETGPFGRELAPGLVVAAYLPPEIPDPGYSRPPAGELDGTDPRLYVVTVDPAHYELVYRSILDDEGGSHRTAAEWATDEGLHVAFNPGMFEPDGRATGYTSAGAFVSQPSVRRQPLYRSWFVAGPDGWVTLDQRPPKGEGKYGSLDELPEAFRVRLAAQTLVSQSLAIVRDGQGVYPPRISQWSELAYGTDDQGRLVVVFSRYPYEMRELGARVAALDLGIDALLHGEGGPEASLVVRAGGVELVRWGSYETGFFGDDNQRQWALPAVLGARPR